MIKAGVFKKLIYTFAEVEKFVFIFFDVGNRDKLGHFFANIYSVSVVANIAHTLLNVGCLDLKAHGLECVVNALGRAPSCVKVNRDCVAVNLVNLGAVCDAHVPLGPPFFDTKAMPIFIAMVF